MTDFDRVKEYYRFFDEKNRLVNSGSGRLEFLMSMELLKRWLPGKGSILDLGGGAGAYSFPLAAEGYKVFLADLSEEQIQQAEEQNREVEHPVICNVVKMPRAKSSQRFSRMKVLLKLDLTSSMKERSSAALPAAPSEGMDPGAALPRTRIPIRSS